MAVWPSGKAVDCKSSIPSSNLGAALKTLTIVLCLSKFFAIISNSILGNVVKLVDTMDLKSIA